jgi:tungstate transport system ATP-binding protein
MTTAPLYRLDSLRYSYGPRTVLDIPDLTIDSGRLYLLTGANGSGKSTLLSILALLTSPTTGTVSFRGAAVQWDNRSLLAARRRVTLLHQAPYLFNESVYTNVAFGLKARGITGKEQHAVVEQALAVVELAGFEKRKARELSGGEAQRVAMARALAFRPEVLLLDEPLANVDRDTALLLEKVVVSLPQQGTSVIMTTHDPAQPGRLAAERLHLVAGKIAPVPQQLPPV